MAYKWCVVTQCKNTSINTPEKLFVSVPTNPKKRKLWLRLARREPNSISMNTNIFMCEDHFNLETDLKNYMMYRMGFSQKILLADEAVPTKFNCQEDRKRRLSGGPSRSLFLKRHKKDFITECLHSLSVTETCVETLQEDNVMPQNVNEPEGSPSRDRDNSVKAHGFKGLGMVGVPHPTVGEVTLAFVSLQPDAKLTERLYEITSLRETGKMALSGSGAVFFLGSRAHYQVLEPGYDTENGNTSTETIYQNTSVEELWPSEQNNVLDDKYDRISWNFDPNDVNVFYEREHYGGNHCIKRRIKRHSSEALLGDDMKPSMLNSFIDSEPSKHKSYRRTTVMQFLSSLSLRKRRAPDQVQYLQHMDTGLISCTYRESCRCLDCQGRYFECAEDSEDYSSDDEGYDVHDLDNPSESNDEVFLDPDRQEKFEKPIITQQEEKRLAEDEPDKQLQLEVAASTSAMLNLLLYHPFSCVVQ